MNFYAGTHHKKEGIPEPPSRFYSPFENFFFRHFYNVFATQQLAYIWVTTYFLILARKWFRVQFGIDKHKETKDYKILHET